MTIDLFRQEKLTKMNTVRSLTVKVSIFLMVEKLWICADRKLTCLKSHSKIKCFLSGSWFWKHCGSVQTIDCIYKGCRQKRKP